MNITQAIPSELTFSQSTQKDNPEESTVSNAKKSGRKVTSEPGKKTEFGKNLPFKKKVCIVLRSIKKITILAYYMVKTVVFKIPLDTSKKIENVLNLFGPAFIKSLQTLGPESIDTLAKLCLNFKKGKNLSENEKKKLYSIKEAISGIYANCKITEMKLCEAQEIINKNFGDKYEVIKCIGSGTIAACFEIKDNNGNIYVAKVMRNEHIESMREANYLFGFFNKIYPTSQRHLTKTMCEIFMEECSLIRESENLRNYHNVLSKNNELEWITFDCPQTSDKVSFSLEISAPNLVEVTSSDNLFVMEKAEGHTLNEVGDDEKLFKELFSTSFGYTLTDENLEEIQNKVLDLIYDKIIDKWSEMTFKNKLAHGDMHPGNIMISFGKQKKEVKVSIIDFGHTTTLTDNNINFLREFSSIVDSFNSIDKRNQGDLEKIFKLNLCSRYREHATDIKNVNLGLKSSSGNNILEEISKEESEHVKKLFDILIAETGNEKLSNKEKEQLYRVCYYFLALTQKPGFLTYIMCPEYLTKMEMLNDLTIALLDKGLNLQKWLFRFLIAAERSRFKRLDSDYLK